MLLNSTLTRNVLISRTHGAVLVNSARDSRVILVIGLLSRRSMRLCPSTAARCSYRVLLFDGNIPCPTFARFYAETGIILVRIRRPEMRYGLVGGSEP